MIGTYYRLSLADEDVGADLVVCFLGAITADTEICLPEIEIAGTTIFVLSHRRVIACAGIVGDVALGAALSAAATGTA